MSNVILEDVFAVDRILRLLYHGTRPPGVHFLICSCGAVANLKGEDVQAVGWQLLPTPLCPRCLDPEPYTGPARERYLSMVNRLLETGKVGE